MVAICYRFHVFIPAGSTIPAFVPLIGSRADAGGFVGRFALGQYHRRMLETSGRFLPDHMGRGAENQVLGQGAILVKVRLHDPILAGRDPVKGSGRVLCHGADIPKVRHGLDIARVVPSEVFYPLPIQQRDHGSGPSGILQTLESVLKCSLDDREDIAALQGIAARADATLDGTQFGTSGATLRRDASGKPGHFRGLGKPTYDGIQFLDGTGHRHGGILHGDGVSLSDGEIHGGHASIIAYPTPRVPFKVDKIRKRLTFS